MIGKKTIDGPASGGTGRRGLLVVAFVFGVAFGLALANGRSAFTVLGTATNAGAGVVDRQDRSRPPRYDPREAFVVSAARDSDPVLTTTSSTAPPLLVQDAVVRLRTGNATTLWVTTGGTEEDCRALCSTLAAASLCRASVWVDEKSACLVMSSALQNISVEDVVSITNRQHATTKQWQLVAPNVRHALRQAAVAKFTNAVASAASAAAAAGSIHAFFQRLPASASVVSRASSLLTMTGAPLEACLVECHRRTLLASDVVGRRSREAGPGGADNSNAQSAVVLPPAPAACLHVEWEPATGRCRLLSREALVLGHADRVVYQWRRREPRQPAAGGTDDTGNGGGGALNVDDIVGPVRNTAFVVLAADRQVLTRLRAAVVTWLRAQRVLVLVEDTPAGRGGIDRLFNLSTVAANSPVFSSLRSSQNNGSAEFVSARFASAEEFVLYPNPFGASDRRGNGTLSVAFVSAPASRLHRGGGGAWKNLAGLSAVNTWLKRNPELATDVKWWMVVDDDTFVLPNALSHLLDMIPYRLTDEWKSTPTLTHHHQVPTTSSTRDPASDNSTDAAAAAADGRGVQESSLLFRNDRFRHGLFFGQLFLGDPKPFDSSAVGGAAMESVLPVGRAALTPEAIDMVRRSKANLSEMEQKVWLNFPQGGSGIVLDAVAMKRMVGIRDTCLAACLQWAGDIRTACCAALANVSRPHHELSMWSESPYKIAATYAARRLVHPFPTSFHRMRNPKAISLFWNLMLSEARMGNLLSWRRIRRFALSNSTLYGVPPETYHQ